MLQEEMANYSVHGHTKTLCNRMVYYPRAGLAIGYNQLSSDRLQLQEVEHFRFPKMNARRFIAIAILIAGASVQSNAQIKKLAAPITADALGLESGLIAYERDIKFNFQEHAENVTEYSIAFFENADSLEFWGHGRTYLGIYGPIQKMDGEEREEFTRRVNECYNTFKNTVRNKGRIYQHVDINLYDNMVFTCYNRIRVTHFG